MLISNRLVVSAVSLVYGVGKGTRAVARTRTRYRPAERARN